MDLLFRRAACSPKAIDSIRRNFRMHMTTLSPLLFSNTSATTLSQLLFSNTSATTLSQLLFSNTSATTLSQLLFSNTSATTLSQLLFSNATTTTYRNVLNILSMENYEETLAPANLFRFLMKKPADLFLSLLRLKKIDVSLECKF